MAGDSLIRFYRSQDTNAATVEDLRFWAVNELRRIQDMGRDIEEQLVSLAGLIDALENADSSDNVEIVVGPPGPPGPPGADGQDGRDGRDGDAGDLIDDSRTLFGKTWSSQKIASELQALENQIGEGGSDPGEPFPEAPASGCTYGRHGADMTWYPVSRVYLQDEMPDPVCAGAMWITDNGPLPAVPFQLYDPDDDVFPLSTPLLYDPDDDVFPITERAA